MLHPSYLFGGGGGGGWWGVGWGCNGREVDVSWVCSVLDFCSLLCHNIHLNPIAASKLFVCLVVVVEVVVVVVVGGGVGWGCNGREVDVSWVCSVFDFCSLLCHNIHLNPIATSELFGCLVGVLFFSNFVFCLFLILFPLGVEVRVRGGEEGC